MNILFLTSWYPSKDRPYWAPFVREHAKAASLYHNVAVLAPPVQTADLASWWKWELDPDDHLTYGIPTYRLYWKKLGLPKVGYFPLYACYLSVIRHLRRTGFRPDVLHLHVYEMGFPAIRLAKLFGLPVVVSEHTTLFPEKRLSPPDLRIAKYAFERARVVLPDARSLGQAILDYGIRTTCRFVPNVVQTDVFHPPATPRPANPIKSIVFVGGFRPTHVKGVPQLLAALTAIARERTDWHLHLIGRGPALAEMEAKARELGLEKLVTFHGGRPMPEIAERMRQADFFVLPSLWENFPCALIEAIASGLPVIASTTGDVPQMVDDETGLLVPPGDVEKLTAAIRRMLDEYPKYDRQKIAVKAAYCSPASVGKQLSEVYQEVVDSAR